MKKLRSILWIKCSIKDNDVFEKAYQYIEMYFRNALVRTNYRNPSKGIEPNKSFLAKFFRNLMLGEHHELKNRYMLIGYSDVDDTHTSTHTSFDETVSALSEKYKAVNHCDWHSEGLEVYNRLNFKPFDDRFR